MSKPLTEARVPLAFPVTVKSADGKDAQRTMLVFGRPKTRHVKRLAVLLGADLARHFLGGDDAKASFSSAELSRIAGDLVSELLTASNLDELTAILADLAGEEVAVIDDLDALDLFAVGKALLNFFPSLKSLPSAS